jgi:hypothetical protein
MEESRYALLALDDINESLENPLTVSVIEYQQSKRQLFLYKTLFHVLLTINILAFGVVLFTSSFTPKPMLKSQSLLGQSKSRSLNQNPKLTFYSPEEDHHLQPQSSLRFQSSRTRGRMEPSNASYANISSMKTVLTSNSGNRTRHYRRTLPMGSFRWHAITREW